MNFLKIIKSQREEAVKEKWSGTFLEYLEQVQKDPTIIKLAAKRLVDSIESYGADRMEDADPRCRKLFDGDKIKTYGYFKEEFYGHERVIAKLMRFLKSAALKGEESRQVLLLMGPVGSGKSALADAVKRSLERAADPVYHLDGCPVREEPMHLVPRSLRPKLEEILSVNIEGDLCPVCRHRLMEEFKGEYEKFPVVCSGFSQRGRRGILKA